MSDGYSLLPPAGQIKSKLHVAADLSLVTQSYTTTCFWRNSQKGKSRTKTHTDRASQHQQDCDTRVHVSSPTSCTPLCLQPHSEPGRRCRAPLRRNQLGLGASQNQDEGSGAEEGERSHSGMDGGQSTSTDWDTNTQLTQHLLDEITLKKASHYSETLSYFLFNSLTWNELSLLQLWDIICSWAADDLLR